VQEKKYPDNINVEKLIKINDLTKRLSCFQPNGETFFFVGRMQSSEVKIAQQTFDQVRVTTF
jgi:hypothetical protein